MPIHSKVDMFPAYFSKIKALGYTIDAGEHDALTISPLRPFERWKLQHREERWLLLVNETPQIFFQPEEVIKFLVFRKFPNHSQRLIST